MDLPVPRRNEVLIQVHGSSINIDDIHLAEGTFFGGLPVSPRPRKNAPVIPGSDVAGVVVAVGRKVRSLQAGDPVFGVHLPFHRIGAWAEFCAVDERWLTKKPDQISFETAAACGISGVVAVSAINALKISAGMRLVIVGVSGGIGALAAQLAIRAGAQVIGICGTRNLEHAHQLGCSLALDYSQGAWDRLLLAEGIQFVDRVLDTVGGKDIEEMGRRALRREGLFVSIVGPRRFIGDRPLGGSEIASTIAQIGYRMAASFVRGPRYILTGPGLNSGGLLADVAEAADAGILPPIDSVVPFALEPMREALRRAAAHENNGRIVIAINGC